MDEIRVGICGAGSIVNTHLATIERVKGVRAIAVSSRTIKTARKTAKKYKVKNVYDDHRRVIESPDVDVVLIATPNYQHAPLALAAIAAGKPVMIEKPLAMNAREGKKVVEAAKKAKLPLIYAEQLPLAPKFVRLIEAAKAGEFGELYMIRQIERHEGPYSPWFFKKKTAGGGVLMDLGCHSISVVLEFFDKPKIKNVTGFTRTYTHKHGNVEDFALIRMDFGNGAVGVVEANWCHLGGMDSITEAFGSKGVGSADLMKGSGLLTYSEAGVSSRKGKLKGWQRPMIDPLLENGYIAQIEGMVDTLINGAPPLQSGDDGLLVLEIMDAAYRSAKQD
jgi:predicted dehydrogenase